MRKGILELSEDAAYDGLCTDCGRGKTIRFEVDTVLNVIEDRRTEFAPQGGVCWSCFHAKRRCRDCAAVFKREDIIRRHTARGLVGDKGELYYLCIDCYEHQVGLAKLSSVVRAETRQ